MTVFVGLRIGFGSAALVSVGTVVSVLDAISKSLLISVEFYLRILKFGFGESVGFESTIDGGVALGGADLYLIITKIQNFRNFYLRNPGLASPAIALGADAGISSKGICQNLNLLY